MDVAVRVARGQLDLNTALTQMAQRDQAEALVARHGLERALATQVVLGQADLEGVLRKRRVEAMLAEHRGAEALSAAQASGAEVVVGVHGRRLLRAVVVEVRPYEVELRDADTGTTSTVHKTAIKFACDAAGWPRARKSMTWDDARKAVARDPVLRPQDRYGCSNRRLGEAWDKKSNVVAVTLEGECFAGQVSYVARWEFGLRTRAGVDVVIFRHALDDFQE